MAAPDYADRGMAQLRSVRTLAPAVDRRCDVVTDTTHLWCLWGRGPRLPARQRRPG